MDYTERDYYVAGILMYLFIGILWYAIDKDIRNRYTRFHLRQSLNFWIVLIAIQISIQFVFFILKFLLVIPVFGWLINAFFKLLVYVIELSFLIIWIFGLRNALQSKEEPLKVIGNLAEKYLVF